MVRETGIQKIVIDAALLNIQHYKLGMTVGCSNPGNGVEPHPR